MVTFFKKIEGRAFIDSSQLFIARLAKMLCEELGQC
jgi:hypothetical protein